jgi:uncharacterized protein YjiS (DUF1127 family)
METAMTTIRNSRRGGWTNPLAPILHHLHARRIGRQLREMDDHMLCDIGLTRADVEDAIASRRL